jgi:hypothetical protein
MKRSGGCGGCFLRGGDELLFDVSDSFGLYCFCGRRDARPVVVAVFDDDDDATPLTIIPHRVCRLCETFLFR